MPDPKIDAALWVVEDATAAAVVAPLTDGAPVIRLDLPGWRVALGALPVPASVAVAIGAGAAAAELGTTLAALGTAERIELLLCGGGQRPDGLAEALTWTGRSAADLDAVEVGGTSVLRLSVTTGEGSATVPVLAALARTRPARRPVGVSWHVGVLGAAARSWLGGWVRTVAVPRDALGDLEQRLGHLDVLAVSPAEGWSGQDTAALVAEAQRAGTPVVAVAAGDEPWAASADARIGPDLAPHPVDVTVVNPSGWQRRTPDVLAVVPGRSPSDLDGALAAVHDRVERAGVRVVGEAAAAEVPVHSAGLIQVLRDTRGVVDHPGLHADATTHAAWLVQLAVAAVPVACLDLPDEVADLLGERLAGVVRGTRLADLADPDERERRTVLARRAAWPQHTLEARWRRLAPALGLPVPRPRSFSIVLATNRPDFLDHAIAQVAGQAWRPAEFVAALHGDAFAPGTEARVTAGTDLPTTVVRVDGAQPLGEVLNQACQVASGDVVTKWDDDDWYSPDHLLDLAITLDHSGAQLVGKAAEFVYLSRPDLTIRRFTTGAETGSRTIAGGTLTFPRDVWRDVGGFVRVGLAEDQRLIGDVLAAGGTIHRTHGFGYVLHRHGHHAWAAEDDYFRQQADSERPGLDHEWTLT